MLKQPSAAKSQTLKFYCHHAKRFVIFVSNILSGGLSITYICFKVLGPNVCTSNSKYKSGRCIELIFLSHPTSDCESQRLTFRVSRLEITLFKGFVE